MFKAALKKENSAVSSSAATNALLEPQGIASPSVCLSSFDVNVLVMLCGGCFGGEGGG